MKRNDQTFLNVAKLGKLKTLSLRDKFGVFLGEEKDKLFEVTVDLFGRTMAFRNNDGELVVQMTKTTKALIKETVLGLGMEYTIDIAPGLDVSIVLASVFGVMQVGNSRKYFIFLLESELIFLPYTNLKTERQLSKMQQITFCLTRFKTNSKMKCSMS